jgi:hypothetical protein
MSDGVARTAGYASLAVSAKAAASWDDPTVIDADAAAPI